MQLFKYPHIRDRLRRNILPSDLEKAEILLSIDRAKTRLAEIEAHDATDDAVALRAYIADYSSLLATIRRFPTEVLQLIFVQPDLHDRKWIANGPNRVTIYRTKAIVAVSYCWRAAALGTSILWSSFQISLRRRQCPDLGQLRTRLERSKNCPLSISFSSAYLYPEDGSAELQLHAKVVKEITVELLRHAERWVQLVVPLEYPFLALFSLAQGRLRCLEELAFGDSIDTIHNSKLLTLKIFQDAPKLRSLSMRGTTYLPTLPWDRLTRITAPHKSVLATEQILQLSPGLRDVMLYLDPNPTLLEHPMPNHPRRGPGIRTVALNGLDSARVYGLTNALASMETPELKEIRIIRCAWSPVSSIPSLVQRSRCSLQTLVLDRTHIRPADLLALFPAVPTLETLVLVDNFLTAVTNSVLEGLTPSSSGLNVGLLPLLHTLVLRGTYLCSTDKLFTLLENRMRFQHPIVNLDIALYERDPGASDLDRFAVLPGAVPTYSARVLSVYGGSSGRSPEDTRYIGDYFAQVQLFP